MLHYLAILALAGTPLVAAGAGKSIPSPDIVTGMRTRNVPGTTDRDTHLAIRKVLSETSLEKRELVHEDSTSLDKSWEDSVLLQLAL